MGVASEMFKLLFRGAIYEKLIANKEKENMSEQLDKSFKGVIIPPLADTPEGREAVRKGHRGDKDYCFIADIKYMTSECLKAKRRCDDCIACLNCGDARRKREVFKEYDRRYPVEGAMPELKPGMIVRKDMPKSFSQYFFLVSKRDDHSFICYRMEAEERTCFRLAAPCILSRNDKDISAVYCDLDLSYFDTERVLKILQGSKRYLLWEKPDPVKEMTVDEISKALGYKVKVVGSEKADD
jgi:hypothetical protein